MTNTTHAATATPAMSHGEVTDRLARRIAGRILAGERIVAATRTAGAGAVLLIGSLAARGGDALSDLDLLVVTGNGYTGIDMDRLFGPQLLAQTTAPDAAPRGGTATGVCLDVAGVVLWLDIVQWPMATAAIPADSLIVYAHLDLPYSPLPYSHLLDHHIQSTAPIHPPSAATELRRVADAAKHLARGGNPRRIIGEVPEAIGIRQDHIRPLLHQRLAAIDQPDLIRAIAGTAALVDLADLVRTSTPAHTTTRRDGKTDT